jgi:hypothetical protein
VLHSDRWLCADYPVAATQRDKPVIQQVTKEVLALDHSFIKAAVVPSLLLDIEIPDSVDSSWYGGQVIVTLKDKVFARSSPHRHALETVTALEGRYLRGGEALTEPVFFYVTDGGSDHNTKHAKVGAPLPAFNGCLVSPACLTLLPLPSSGDPRRSVPCA